MEVVPFPLFAWGCLGVALEVALFWGGVFEVPSPSFSFLLALNLVTLSGAISFCLFVLPGGLSSPLLLLFMEELGVLCSGMPLLLGSSLLPLGTVEERVLARPEIGATPV